MQQGTGHLLPKALPGHRPLASVPIASISGPEGHPGRLRDMAATESGHLFRSKAVGPMGYWARAMLEEDALGEVSLPGTYLPWGVPTRDKKFGPHPTPQPGPVPHLIVEAGNF